MKLIRKKHTEESTEQAKSTVSGTNKYSKLQDALDYKRDFAMFYSGVEYEVYLKGCYDMGVRNFLMSYEYVGKRSLKQITEKFDEKIHLFVDSGAFTYMGDEKYYDYTEEQWEKHIEKYLKWAEKNRDYIFAIANLDIERLVGAEKVLEWNAKYFEPFMLRTGIIVCFIWHYQSSAMSWEQYCQRYPYVGMTNAADKGVDVNDEGYYRGMLNTAAKYNALVHGMGMTRTSMLPNLPFYTVDSTSWKVGMRYGLTSVWEKNKVKQYKKEEWDRKIVPVIQNYKDAQFDLAKLKEFYEPEVIKANVYAYMKAEEYIVDKLQSLEYWKKPKSVENNVDNLPADFFPDERKLLDQIYTYEELQSFAVKMNINPNLEIEDLDSFIRTCTAFMNWDNDTYLELKDIYIRDDFAALKVAHGFFINRMAETNEDMIDDLHQFFVDTIEGRNTMLLYFGTNFDRQQKERDSYIEEDEERELVPMTLQQVRDELSQYLPAPGDDGTAPEIDELDAEIFAKADIVPTFDEHGKFIKGQKSVRAPKKVYSKKFPKLACSNCFMAAKCPEYKDGYVCAYNKMFDRFDTRNMTDIIESMQGIVGHGMKRLQIAMMFEMMNGNIDPAVTALANNTLSNLNFLKSMYENASAEVIKQSRVIRADGSVEENTSVHNPRSGGILEKIFGGMGGEKDVQREKEEKENAEIIDAEEVKQ